MLFKSLCGKCELKDKLIRGRELKLTVTGTSMQMTVAQLAEQLDAELLGDGTGQIRAVSTIEEAGANEVAFS